MIWARVTSQSCLCLLYRISLFWGAKNIINLIFTLAIWWCPCVKLSLVLLERVFSMTSELSWLNYVILCPGSFCTTRSNLLVTPGISWHPTFSLQSPMMRMTHILVLVLEGIVGLHRTGQPQLLSHFFFFFFFFLIFRLTFIIG